MGLKDVVLGALSSRRPRVGGEVAGLDVSGMDTTQISIFQPVTFFDITQLVKKMRGNSPLIINFLRLDHSQAERSLDFVCGAVCALNGKFEKIGEGIYFFAPAQVSIHTDKKSKRI